MPVSKSENTDSWVEWIDWVDLVGLVGIIKLDFIILAGCLVTIFSHSGHLIGVDGLIVWVGLDWLDWLHWMKLGFKVHTEHLFASFSESGHTNSDCMH